MFDLNNTATSFKLCHSCDFRLRLGKIIRDFLRNLNTFQETIFRKSVRCKVKVRSQDYKNDPGRKFFQSTWFEILHENVGKIPKLFQMPRDELLKTLIRLREKQYFIHDLLLRVAITILGFFVRRAVLLGM